MELSAAATLAKTLMAEHGLTGWLFLFDSSKRRFGQCRPSQKWITLSKHLVALNPENEVRQTIIHEIAHALVPIRMRRGRWEMHGPAWQAKMRALGGIPVRCYDGTSERNVVKVPPKFYYVCGNCTLRIPRFKKAKGKLACSVCCSKFNGGKFTDRFLLTWAAA